MKFMGVPSAFFACLNRDTYGIPHCNRKQAQPDRIGPTVTYDTLNYDITQAQLDRALFVTHAKVNSGIRQAHGSNQKPMWRWSHELTPTLMHMFEYAGPAPPPLVPMKLFKLAVLHGDNSTIRHRGVV